MSPAPPTVEEGAAPGAAPQPSESERPRGSVIGPRVAAGLLLAGGLALFADALRAAVQDGVTLGGPRVAPLAVTAGWVVVAAVYCVQQVRSPQGAQIKVGTPALLVVALVSYTLVLKYTVAGYVISTTIFFIAVARLLSIRPVREVLVRDVVTAATISLGIYLLSTRMLGLSLPAGVLPL